MAEELDRGKHAGHKILRIQVTEEDIRRATKTNSMRCVVAQAVARTIPEASRIDVDVQAIRWTEGDERFVYLTPSAVQGYVVAFDAGEDIHPFSFRIDSRLRVPVRTRVRTEAGKATQKARNQKVAALRMQKRVQQAVADKKLPAEELAQAQTAVAEAEDNYAAVTARYANQAGSMNKDESSRKAPPKVFRSSERAYGMRSLRINQPNPEAAE